MIFVSIHYSIASHKLLEGEPVINAEQATEHVSFTRETASNQTPKHACRVHELERRRDPSPEAQRQSHGAAEKPGKAKTNHWAPAAGAGCLFVLVGSGQAQGS